VAQTTRTVALVKRRRLRLRVSLLIAAIAMSGTVYMAPRLYTQAPRWYAHHFKMRWYNCPDQDCGPN